MRISSIKKTTYIISVVIIYIFIAANLTYAPTWSIEIVESTGFSISNPSIDIDSFDVPHLSYVEGLSLKYAVKSGASWTIETVDSRVLDTSLDIDSSGTSHIAYYNYFYADLMYAVKTDSGWNIETVDSAGSVGDWVSIAVDSYGNPHISYHDRTNRDLKYAVKIGSSWIIETVDSVGYTGHYTSIVVDSNDDPHISYTTSNYYGNSNILKYAVKKAGVWNIEAVDWSGDVGRFSSIDIDSVDNPHISYWDFKYFDLKFASKSSGTWIIEVVDSINDVGALGDLSIGSSDEPYIVYIDRSNYDLKFAVKSGGIWDIEVLDSGLVFGQATIELDSTNNPHVGYSGYNPVAMIYASAILADTTPPSISAPSDLSKEATGQLTPVSTEELGYPIVNDSDDPNPSVTNDAPELFPLGETEVTWTATDASGNSASDKQIVTIIDTTPPTITGLEDIELIAYSLSGVLDPDLGPIQAFDLADPNPTLTNDAPALFLFGVTNVTWTALDSSGLSTYATQKVTVNTPPEIISLKITPNLTSINTPILAIADFSNPDLDDTNFASWDWGDGTVSGPIPLPASSGTFEQEHVYDTPGLYTVTLMVTDQNFEVSEIYNDTRTFQFVVIYNPAGSFVSGAGWIDSPEGAYSPDPSLSGKAIFAFVSKFSPGTVVPTGRSIFHFNVAKLNFRSNDFDWLVVAGARAQFKGTGTIDGEGNFGFMITAIDGILIGGDEEDQFRIKIWDRDTDELIYDNKFGEDDDTQTLTTIGGGSIVVHEDND